MAMVRTLAVTALCAALCACSSPEPSKKEAAAPPKNVTAPDVFRVALDTSKGPVVIEVHRDWAPIGADHFYSLVKTGFYDGNRFFRVVRNFVVQFGINGDPKVNRLWSNANLPDDPVKQHNTRGTVTYATAGPTRARRRSSSTSETIAPRSTGPASPRSARSSPAWTRSTASTAATATCPRAARAPTPRRSNCKAMTTSPAIFPGSTIFRKRRSSDILRKAPMLRGPGSYQYRVKLERRGPAASIAPAGFFIGRAGPLAWVSP